MTLIDRHHEEPFSLLILAGVAAILTAIAGALFGCFAAVGTWAMFFTALFTIAFLRGASTPEESTHGGGDDEAGC